MVFIIFIFYTGECISNPNFMWTQCHTSCMTGDSQAGDVEDRCSAWSEEGECTNNPNYIQLHCPISCGQAVGWSPWARREVGVDMYLEFDSEIATEDCQVPVNLFAAAELIKKRLSHYFNGGASSVSGLSSSAPSEFLGMMGLAEAFLYAFRLYGVVLNSDPENLFAPSIEANKRHIQEVTHILSQGYGSDLLMRTLPTFLPLLSQSSDFAAELMFAPNPNIPCPQYDGAKFQQLVQSFPSLKKPSSDYALGNDVILNNGVSMPALGLGTCECTIFPVCSEFELRALSTLLLLLCMIFLF